MSGKVLSAPFQYTKLQLVGLFGTLKTYFKNETKTTEYRNLPHQSLKKSQF